MPDPKLTNQGPRTAPPTGAAPQLPAAASGSTSPSGPAIARDALELSSAAPVGGSAGLSPQVKEALIRAVAAEARGESPEVWMAVAQTILNHARKNRLNIPRLVRTSYLSSNFDGNRRYYTMPLGRIPNLEGITRAVEGAARGESIIGPERTNFHDISIKTPSYGDRKTALRIGRMVFYELKDR